MKKKAKKKEKKDKKAARYSNTMIGEPVQPDTVRTTFRNGTSAPEKGEKEVGAIYPKMIHPQKN